MRALWILVFLLVLLNPVSAGGTVSIVGDDASWNHYSIVVSDSINPFEGITNEDNVEDLFAEGAVSSGTDTYSFEGHIVDIEIEEPERATIVLNGRNTSIAEIKGLRKNVSAAINLSGSQRNNSFYVKPGEIVSIERGKHWFYTYAKGDIELRPLNSDSCSSIESIKFEEENLSKSYTDCPGRWFSTFERNNSGFVNFTLSTSEKTYFQLKAEKGEKSYFVSDNVSNVSDRSVTVNLSIFGLRDTQENFTIYRNGEVYYTQKLNITTGLNTYSGNISVTEGVYKVKFDGKSLNNFTVSSSIPEKPAEIEDKPDNSKEESSSDSLYLLIGLVAILIFIVFVIAILSIPYFAYRKRELILSEIDDFKSKSSQELTKFKKILLRRLEKIQTWWNGQEFEPEKEIKYQGPKFTSEDE